MSSDRHAVLIFAQNATVHDGGEAARPLHYFQSLRAIGVDAHLLVHERNREVLSEQCPEDLDRVHFVPETWLDRACAWIGDRLPERINVVTTSTLSWMATQGRARRVIRRLIPDLGIGVIHQPTPIAPRSPSRIHGFQVPVVIGPLNGAIDLPSAFRKRQSAIEFALVKSARLIARPLSHLCRGIREARVVMVSSLRTRKALPSGLSGRVVDLVANAVHTKDWVPQQCDPKRARVRFLFSGRLLPFKAVDLLLEASRGYLKWSPLSLRSLATVRFEVRWSPKLQSSRSINTFTFLVGVWDRS